MPTGAPPEERAPDGHAPRPVRAGVRLLRRLPFTLGFLAVMVVANAASGTVSGRLDPEVLGARGIGLDAIRDGDPTRFVTAIFLSHDLPMLLRQLPFAALVIGRAEWLWGSTRAAGLFFGIDLAAGGILLAAIALIPALAPLAATTDVGMSLGGFGLIGVLVARGRRGWAALVAILALVAGKSALAPEPLADAGHAIALVLGFGVGVVLGSLGRPAPGRLIGRDSCPMVAGPGRAGTAAGLASRETATATTGRGGRA